MKGMDPARTTAAVGRRLPTAWYEKQVSEYLRRVKADVVLAEYGPTGVAVMNACLRSTTPLVVHFHGFDAYKTETVERLRESYKRLFQIADRMVAVSHHMVNRLRELGAPPERVLLQPLRSRCRCVSGGAARKSGPRFRLTGPLCREEGTRVDAPGVCRGLRRGA